jgi:hypothetical protein
MLKINEFDKRYWTRERVVDGLKRFYKTYKTAPSSQRIDEMTRDVYTGSHRTFPPKNAVFQHFATMYEAWVATGIAEAIPKCSDCKTTLDRPRIQFCDPCRSKRASSRSRTFWRKKHLKYQYTDEFDQEIRDLYNLQKRNPKRARIKEFAESKGVPRWVVSKRAVSLGILRPRWAEIAWSEKELELLRNYAHLGTTNIRKKMSQYGFKRTETAINLQLKRCDFRAESQLISGTQFGKLIGEDGHKISYWAEQGVLPFEWKGTTRTEKQGGDSRMFHLHDIYCFLVTQRNLYDLRKVNQDWLLIMLVDYAKEHRQELDERLTSFAVIIPAWSLTEWKRRRNSKLGTLAA